MDRKILFIAAACHNLNRAYCLSIGDTSQMPWDEAPDNIKASAVAGVKMHLANPNATPEESHASWLAHKLAEGWVFGPVKDLEKKEHPCMVEYGQLPPAQRTKDYLFKAVVDSMRQLPEDPLQEIPPAATVTTTPTGTVQMATPQGFLPVQYVGRREHYTDGLYGTKLAFVKGQTRLVPRAPAVLMLKHPDVYVLGKADDVAAGFTANAALVSEQTERRKDDKNNETEEERQAIEDAHTALGTMNRKQLANYAKINFNQEFDPEKEDVGELRSKVKRLVDQFGLPGSKQ